MPPDAGSRESRFPVSRAAAVLRSGGLVAYPTEGVYGLGCDPLDERAVRRLLQVKQRPMHKGLILIASEFTQIEPFIGPLREGEFKKAMATWPGPVTWVMPARADTPAWLRGDHPTIAVRVTAHPLAASLCQAFGGAIVSTSANLAGRPPARNALQARLRTGSAIDFVLSGATGGRQGPTPIFDVKNGSRLRAG
ncbi:MAG: threonylcarbamoyl-AMP synthase [Gammaproteobacteria bacterium]|nr:threonylcarbamoyl-AMP synthase [Gammaproteobacteria bacterium]MCB1737208.1 threonylcarbamoyl-AMP synthase [Gammaproteobacteria bacterium]MCP5136713.1 threonylcarbamoyl-AMP synthase [Gammaproteobacteria bacterium]